MKDSLGFVPFGRLPRTARVVSLTIAPRTDLGAGATFNAELARVFPSLRSLTLSPESLFDATAAARRGAGPGRHRTSRARNRALLPALVENALRGAQGADLVIVSSYFGASSSTVALAAPDGMADLHQRPAEGRHARRPRHVQQSVHRAGSAADASVSHRVGQLAARAARRRARVARPGADHRPASDHHSVSRAVRRRTATRRVAADAPRPATP